MGHRSSDGGSRVYLTVFPDEQTVERRTVEQSRGSGVVVQMDLASWALAVTVVALSA